MASKLKLMNQNGKSIEINSGSIEGDKVLEPTDFKYIRNTVTEMLDLNDMLVDGDVVFLKGYHSVNDGGGGTFIYNASGDKSTHNGGTIIDPSKIFPDDWNNKAKKNDWFNNVNSGVGILERIYNDAINIKWFGANKQYDDNHVSINKALKLHRSIICDNEEYTISAPIIIDNGITESKNGKFIGNKTIIKASDNFDDTCLLSIQLNNSPDNNAFVIDNFHFNGNSKEVVGIDFFDVDTEVTNFNDSTKLENTKYSKNITISKCVIENCFIGSRVTGNFNIFNDCYFFHNALGIFSTQASNSISYISCAFRRNDCGARVTTIDNALGTVENNFTDCIFESNNYSSLEIATRCVNVDNMYCENNGNGNGGGPNLYNNYSLSNEPCNIYFGIGSGGYGGYNKLTSVYTQNCKPSIALVLSNSILINADLYINLKSYGSVNQYGPSLHNSYITNATNLNVDTAVKTNDHNSFIYDGIKTHIDEYKKIVKSYLPKLNNNSISNLVKAIYQKDITYNTSVAHPGDGNNADIFKIIIPDTMIDAHIEFDFFLLGTNSGGVLSHMGKGVATINIYCDKDGVPQKVVNTNIAFDTEHDSNSATPPDYGRLSNGDTGLSTSVNDQEITVTFTNLKNVSVSDSGSCETIETHIVCNLRQTNLGNKELLPLTLTSV